MRFQLPNFWILEFQFWAKLWFFKCNTKMVCDDGDEDDDVAVVVVDMAAVMGTASGHGGGSLRMRCTVDDDDADVDAAAAGLSSNTMCGHSTTCLFKRLVCLKLMPHRGHACCGPLSQRSSRMCRFRLCFHWYTLPHSLHSNFSASESESETTINKHHLRKIIPIRIY